MCSLGDMVPSAGETVQYRHTPHSYGRRIGPDICTHTNLSHLDSFFVPVRPTPHESPIRSDIPRESTAIHDFPRGLQRYCSLGGSSALGLRDNYGRPNTTWHMASSSRTHPPPDNPDICFREARAKPSLAGIPPLIHDFPAGPPGWGSTQFGHTPHSHSRAFSDYPVL